MEGDGAKGSQPDQEQDDFARNAVDPVPWVGQAPDAPGPGDPVSGEGASTDRRHGEPARSDSDVPVPGAGSKAGR
jgi:hypothetical protein